MFAKPLVVASNLNHYFGTNSLRKHILFDINLEIYPGKIAIVTGPSGSGKTTLLNLIGGLRKVQEGSLKVLGKELKNAKEKQLQQTRRKIGFIFQHHNLLESLTALQNVQMSLLLKDGISQREADSKGVAILESVGLSDHIHDYPKQLSGGQNQRVAIARALINQPKLILADEPTAALDKKSGRDVVEIMQTLAKQQGCAIVLVTHDNRILDIADRIIRLEDGCLSSVTGNEVAK